MSCDELDGGEGGGESKINSEDGVEVCKKQGGTEGTPTGTPQTCKELLDSLSDADAIYGCACVFYALALLVLCSSWQPFSTVTSSPCSAPEDKTPLRDTQGGCREGDENMRMKRVINKDMCSI